MCSDLSRAEILTHIQQPNMETVTIRGHIHIIVCFFAIGWLTVFLNEVIAIASVDIFAASSVAMERAVVASGIVQIIVKVTLPLVSPKVFPYNGKIALILVLYTVGFVIIVVASSPESRLVGIIAFETGEAMAEITFLSLTAFYGDLAIKSFVAGGGVGAVLGALYYSGLLTWTCVSPRIAMAFLIPFAFLFVFVYAILDKSPVNRRSRDISFPDVHYDALDDQQQRQLTDKFGIKEKLFVSWYIFMLVTYLFLQYFADSLLIQTVIPTLAFPDEAYYFIGHYTYYTLAHDIGRLIGRSYLLLVSITCSRAASHVQINNTWTLAAAGVILMFGLVFVSWFHSNAEVELIVVFCFIIGVTTGGHYANAPLVVSQGITDTIEKEFSLGILTLGSSAGMYAAGLLGLFLKPHLTEHCLYGLELGKNCLLRFSNFSGWLENVNC